MKVKSVFQEFCFFEIYIFLDDNIHHNMADPIFNVLSEVEYSIIAGIYSTSYIFYFLFVHGYIPVRKARGNLESLALGFEWP